MTRRKKKLYILISILIIIVIVGIAAYQLLFNNLDEESKAEINAEFQQITEDILDEIVSEKDIGAGNTQTNKDDNSKGRADGNPEKGQQKQIVALYEKGFEKLETQGNAIVDNLIDSIKDDYSELKSAGASKKELMKLATSYTNRAKALESGMDSSIKVLLNNLKSDLEAAGLTDKEIESIIENYKNQYEAKKESRRNSILEKAKHYL